MVEAQQLQMMADQNQSLKKRMSLMIVCSTYQQLDHTFGNALSHENLFLLCRVNSFPVWHLSEHKIPQRPKDVEIV